jgi:asparagine synthase (glutamine-hydrolysing)
MQARALHAESANRVFELVDRTWLDAALRQDPTAVSPEDRQGLEWTLNLATWLEIYQPRLDL